MNILLLELIWQHFVYLFLICFSVDIGELFNLQQQWSQNDRWLRLRNCSLPKRNSSVSYLFTLIPILDFIHIYFIDNI